MILEQNPRIGGAVDLGQLEKLKDLKATDGTDGDNYLNALVSQKVANYNKQFLISFHVFGSAYFTR